MKTKSIMVLLFLTVIVIASCKKDSATTTNSNTVTFTATLNAASQVPATTSTATGKANFTYDKTTYMLKGTVTFTGITPTASHIHKGAVGTSGDVIIPLATTTPITSPITLAPMTLDATQRADLLANLYYVNIHSTAFPAGEIRGQLMQQTSSTTGTGTSTGTGTGGY